MDVPKECTVVEEEDYNGDDYVEVDVEVEVMEEDSTHVTGCHSMGNIGDIVGIWIYATYILYISLMI